MPANYWESTHRRHWHFTKEQLATIRQDLEDQNAELVQQYPLQQHRYLWIYFNTLINRLSKRLNIRQQAISTAQVYVKRYYTRVEIRLTNPYLLIAAAVYLASKVEESPQHIRFLVSEAKSLWQDVVYIDTSRLGECEFALIAELNSQLLVHQPYRTLQSLQTDLTLTQEDVNFAWSLINDSYMTDLPLLADPHIIALTAIMIALVFRLPPLAHPQAPPSQAHPAGAQVNLAAITQTQAALAQLAQGQAASSEPLKKNLRFTRVQQYVIWLAESNVDIGEIVDCTQEMVYFYEMQEQYNDKMTKEQINRFVKARNLDK